jgi:anthranilate synthase/aminodeoxychorismate synthase-like glutamine amidotransferase
MKRVLLIDNYDSFTYNLYQAFLILGAEVVVRYNDQITLEEARNFQPTHLVISPGPGTPMDAGCSNEMISEFHQKVPVLGVCLGHQCIGHLFGGTVQRAPILMHGKTSMIIHDGAGIFSGLTNPFAAARYHSLIVAEEGLPKTLHISAHTPAGEIMGLRVKGTKTEGVQFHPESYMTKEGMRLMKNFLETATTDEHR